MVLWTNDTRRIAAVTECLLLALSRRAVKVIPVANRLDLVSDHSMTIHKEG